MLQAVLESTGAAAGALCLYDVRQEVLRLASEIGLSDDGCRKVRTVGRADAESWSIPLHGMLNRRCYLIENAAQNRFVPPLVEDAAKVATVACLPLYSGETPLASLILITRRPRTLGEREVHTVEAPMREIGRLIETMRQGAKERESSPPTPAPVPRIGPGAEGIAATPLRAAVPSIDAASLAAALARVERERDRLAAELETAQRDARGEAEARAADLLAEVERLRARLGEVEADVARERRAHTEQEARLVGSAAAGRRELQRAREAAHEAERARAAAVAETVRVRAELKRIEHVWQGARAQTSGVSAHLVEAEAQLAALREEHTTEVSSLSARLEALAAEVDRLHEAEATISAERDRLAADLEGTAAARAHLEKALQGALEEARARTEETTTQLREARVQAWDVGVRLTEIETTLGASREEHAAEIAALNTRLETLSTEADQLRAAQATRAASRFSLYLFLVVET